MSNHTLGKQAQPYLLLPHGPDNWIGLSRGSRLCHMANNHLQRGIIFRYTSRSIGLIRVATHRPQIKHQNQLPSRRSIPELGGARHVKLGTRMNSTEAADFGELKFNRSKRGRSNHIFEFTAVVRTPRIEIGSADESVWIATNCIGNILIALPIEWAWSKTVLWTPARSILATSFPGVCLSFMLVVGGDCVQ